MPEKKYPLEIETQYLRLRVEEAENRYHNLVRRVMFVGVIALIYGVFMTAGFCFISARHDATVRQMTEEHAKAMKTAVNAQARMVKYGNEGK